MARGRPILLAAESTDVGLSMDTDDPFSCVTHHGPMFTCRFRDGLQETALFRQCPFPFSQFNLEFLFTKREGEREPQVSAR